MSELHVLLLGPPGAGKGTQSQRIADEFDLAHVTTGDALRARKDMETPYGTPREYMEAGELVPDPVVNEIVKAALKDADGFVLDGYPRNLEQADYLDSITELDIILHLEVSREELIKRLTGRRVCTKCGRSYHVEFAPPASDGVCDECGGTLTQREDDTRETVLERLDVHAQTTEPVIEYYRSYDSFTSVNGERPPDAVWDTITTVLEGQLD